MSPAPHSWKKMEECGTNWVNKYKIHTYYIFYRQMTSLALIILFLIPMVPTGATNSTPTTQGYLSTIVTLIIMIKYDLQSCTKFARDQSILWPRRGWSTQLWGSSEYSSTVSSCLCSTERGITWSTASMSWFGLSIYSPEPTSCLINKTLQDGYFLQVDVFMPGELESLQCQLRQKFAQESVLNIYLSG